MSDMEQKMDDLIEGGNNTYDAMCEQINNLESQLKSKDELLVEVYESILNEHTVYEGGCYTECIHCLSGGVEIIHDDNCIVNKAQDYISKSKYKERV